MSRYDGYPGWSSLAGVVALLVLAYLLTCAFMSLHYSTVFYHYEDAAMAIVDSWSDHRNFNESSKCVAERYLAAGVEVADRPLFNVPWMIRNWNRDFLAEQPPCSAKEQNDPL